MPLIELDNNLDLCAQGMLAFTGGRERTARQLGELCASAGFGGVTVTETASPVRMGEATGSWRLPRGLRAADAGELDAAADADDVLRLLIAVIAGIGSQQLANQPEASYDEGIFTRLTDRALAMFVDQHRKER